MPHFQSIGDSTLGSVKFKTEPYVSNRFPNIQDIPSLTLIQFAKISLTSEELLLPSRRKHLFCVTKERMKHLFSHLCSSSSRDDATHDSSWTQLSSYKLEKINFHHKWPVFSHQPILPTHIVQRFGNVYKCVRYYTKSQQIFSIHVHEPKVRQSVDIELKYDLGNFQRYTARRGLCS